MHHDVVKGSSERFLGALVVVRVMFFSINGSVRLRVGPTLFLGKSNIEQADS